MTPTPISVTLLAQKSRLALSHTAEASPQLMTNPRHLLGSVQCFNAIKILVSHTLTASVKVKIKVLSFSDQITVLVAKKS